MKKILFACAIFILIHACSESEIKTYDARNFVHFAPWENWVSPTMMLNEWDTTTLNFLFFPSLQDSTFQVRVNTGGVVTDYDRKFKVSYSSTAKEGVDFEPIETEGIIPAGKNHGFLPVKVKLTESLDNTTYYITLKLLPSDDFTLDYEEKIVDKIPRNMLEMTIGFTAILTPPPIWEGSFYAVLGYFSRNKFMTMNEVLDISMADWLDENSVFRQKNDSYFIVFGNYLNSKVMEGWEAAIKDPDNPNVNDKGYMTIPGGGLGVPRVTIPADFPNLLE